MGEIGRGHHEFLWELNAWQIRAIIRGYYRRHRHLWSATRWQTYNLMCCQSDLKKAGIHSPQDLLKFPWEREEAAGDMLTDKEIADLQRKMREENEKLQREMKKDGTP